MNQQYFDKSFNKGKCSNCEELKSLDSMIKDNVHDHNSHYHCVDCETESYIIQQLNSFTNDKKDVHRMRKIFKWLIGGIH
jgi:hypothetical protein